MSIGIPKDTDPVNLDWDPGNTGDAPIIDIPVEDIPPDQGGDPVGEEHVVF
jgi:hypothetical protein